MSKKCLITGGAGYIGTVLTEILLKSGYQVVCLDRFFFGKEKVESFLSNPNYSYIQDDIRWCSTSIFENIDYVIDMAAISNDPSGDLNPDITNDINNLGRKRICSLAKEAGVKKYILISSCSVYGFNDNTVNEDADTNPLTTYAKANKDAEDVLLEANDSFNVNVLRLGTVFGKSKRMRFDLAINIMTYRAFKNNELQILGQGEQWRPFVHVHDVSMAIKSVLEATNINQQVFNIGDNKNNTKILNLGYLIKKTIPEPITIDIVPDDLDKRSYKVDFSKINTSLGWKAKYSIEDGIKEIYVALIDGEIDKTMDTNTVDWYKFLLQSEKVLNEIIINNKLF